MLLILMYHRVFNTPFPADPGAFEQHLRFLLSHYAMVQPGDQLTKQRLNICLTFDDAYADFYYHVFPLLQQLNCPAVLGVPTGFILPDTTVNMDTRLNVPYADAMAPSNSQHNAPFCTWKELNIMSNSGLVTMASHSHNHVDMTHPNTQLTFELQHSKTLLQNHLNKPIDTFIYPFGKTNRHVHALAAQHYPYVMRIGAAMNPHWHAKQRLYYRVNAEHFWPHQRHWNRIDLMKYRLKYWANVIRKS